MSYSLLLARVLLFLTISGLVAHLVRQTSAQWLFKKRHSSFTDTDGEDF